MDRLHTYRGGTGGNAKRTLGSWAVALVAAVTLAATSAPAANPAHTHTAGRPPSAQSPGSSPGADVAKTTQAYVTRFYPRFLTDHQQLGPVATPVGPDHMGPQWGVVVAPNDDTIYAQLRLDLSKGAQVLTIPATAANYSILTVDVFGDVLHTAIPANTPGAYALVLPGFHGSLPQGVTPITVPYSYTIWTIRADKFTNGTDAESTAETFRKSLHTQSLANYDPASTSGHALVLPLSAFKKQTKTLADDLIRTHPVLFLTKLQSAMHSSRTSPLTSSDAALSRAFDADLAAAEQRASTGSAQELDQMTRATQAAHAAIVKDWKTHTIQGNWVYFDNIGNWGTDYLDRAATAEFLLFGNDLSTSKYFDAFTDATGAQLTGKGNNTYQLTFPASAVPQARRFWSLTAYMPPGITLVPNAALKYAVASYTPGLKTNPDGSITIYVQHNPPVTALMPNWLPVPLGPFSVILRIYGPEGNTSSSSYAPPGISSSHRATRRARSAGR